MVNQAPDDNRRHHSFSASHRGKFLFYLIAEAGGQVEQKYVEDGAILKSGDPILRLSNPDVEYQLAGQVTSVSTMLAQMQLSRVTADQNTVSKLTAVADQRALYIEAKRVYDLDVKLYAQKAIGSQEYQSAVNNYFYLRRKDSLQNQILQSDSLSRTQQEKQDQESLTGAKNTLAILKKKVDGLVIRAPRDGQLTSLDAEVGQY